jgi:hypothetical protein
MVERRARRRFWRAWKCLFRGLRSDRTILAEGGKWTPAGGFGTNASNVLGRQLVQPG